MQKRKSGARLLKFYAQQAVRQKPGPVWLRGGACYLAKKLVFSAADSGAEAAPVVYQAYGMEQPVISGGVRLGKLDWQPYRDGIVQAKVPEDLQTQDLMHREGATNAPATRLHGQSGRNEHSIVADAQFLDPAQGDYRVK